MLRVVFADRTNAEGAELGPTGAESDYQNGKTESLGGVWKRTCYKVHLSEPILTAPDQDELVHAFNCAVNERGPDLRVIGRGKPLREGASEEDGDDISLETVSRLAAGDRALGKSIFLRLAARSAYATESVLDRLDRAKNRRSTPHRGGWQPGDRVFFWRS